MVEYNDGPPTCQRVVEHGGDLYVCGLADWNHDGPCVWFVPGVYLPPPLLHPLDKLPARSVVLGGFRLFRSCPLCGAEVEFAECVFTSASYSIDEWRNEVRWTFEPCGCVARELTDQPVPVPPQS